MDLEKWLPVYRKIVQDMKFCEEEDVAAGRLLEILGRSLRKADLEQIRKRIAGKSTVVAKGPRLRDDLRRLQENKRGPIISAGSATAEVLKAGIVPYLVVSDLDGDVQAEVDANAAGAISCIHAHGDNASALREWVPKFTGEVLLTMQAPPISHILNFGGFTDGDRAVELARHLGARSIELLGFDFEWVESGNVEQKRKKLNWARHIIADLNPRDVLLSSLEAGPL
ncbi:MAG: 6-hydroxymethylpterin diphosphokinase MptE-like protein [Methanomassiliicoccales archaeon]